MDRAVRHREAIPIRRAAAPVDRAAEVVEIVSVSSVPAVRQQEFSAGPAVPAALEEGQ